MQGPLTVGLMVALRKESVDRNRKYLFLEAVSMVVALRKESVDRNRAVLAVAAASAASLSARRAWIEILHPACQGPALRVALRKESVDRNMIPTLRCCV